MFKLLKSSSKMLEDSPEGVVFVYSEDASFAKSAVEVLKEQASKKGKKSKSYPFSKFNDVCFFFFFLFLFTLFFFFFFPLY